MTRATGRRCHALSFRYGQRHAVELEAAARVAAALGAASHSVVSLDLAAVGGSALTVPEMAVPKGRSRSGDRQRHPGHLRPGPQHHLHRLRHRAGRGSRGLRDRGGGERARFLGVSGLPARVAGRHAGGRAPRHEERRRATTGDHSCAPHQDDEGRDHPRRHQARHRYGLTHSCYDPARSGAACGGCDSCQLRRRGFEAAALQIRLSIRDPERVPPPRWVPPSKARRYEGDIGSLPSRSPRWVRGAKLVGTDAIFGTLRVRSPRDGSRRASSSGPDANHPAP